MDNNIVSFQKIAEFRNEALQQKIIHGIDPKELNIFYETVVKEKTQHLSFLQKYLAEEFLGETVMDSFTLGVKASNLRLDNRTIEEIEYVYRNDLLNLLSTLLGQNDLVQYVGEEDTHLLIKMADELSQNWFRKGIVYGEKQRKLRLM